MLCMPSRLVQLCSRVFVAAVVLVGVHSCAQGPPYFIPGSATLPNCTDAPAFDLNNTEWADMGTVTITSEGCAGAMPNEMIASCSLNWVMTAEGSEVDILVDNEYEIKGRLCGTTLHLEGGWWLPVVDTDINQCTYEDDSAEEVGIEMGGSSLTVAEMEMSGTLSVRGPCTATYEVMFVRIR